MSEPIPERLRYYKSVLNDPTKEYTDEDVVIPEADAKARGLEVNICSSLCEDGWHRPALDIDIPCEYIPSSTPGHGHLYFPTVELTWEQYEKLLVALGEAGIIEDGYVAASLERQATYLRLPWVKKTQEEQGSDGTIAVP